MSADEWTDCPKCKQEQSVRIDGMSEYELNEDGTITSHMRGHCVPHDEKYHKYAKGCGFEWK
jgi:hypothetical protein